MRDFKFFRGYNSTLGMINDATYATASFNADTPEGYMNRRMLYYTNQTEYNRLRGNNNNEMEQISNITRRINGGVQHNDNHGNTDYVPFSFGTTRVTRVNPKLWMKMKMFYQNLSLYFNQMWGVIVFAITVIISVGLVISKILNVW